MDGRLFSRILFVFFAVHLLLPAISASKFNYCDKSGNYPVKVDGLQIFPYPVRSGQPALFAVSASTEENLSDGIFEVDVSLFGVPIHSERHDLCKETSCPINPGRFTLSHSQNLPSVTPPALYSVKIILKDAKEDQLTCISFKLRIVRGDEKSAIPEESLVAES